jgi:hypothetical protein
MDVIVFRAFRPKTQQPAKVSPLPVKAEGGKHYTGQGETGFYENLSPQEKEKMSHVITPETIYEIHDGKALKLDNPIDAADWKWIQKHPYISTDRGKDRASRIAVFYVEDKAREATAEITKDKVTNSAKNAMYNSSREELDIAAKALGHPSPEGFSEVEVQKYIVSMIDATPQTVIDIFKPENKGTTNVRSLLSDYLRHNIVVKSRGAYFYGGEHGTHIGRSEQAVVDFLMDPTNAALVDAMTAQMDEINKVPADG